MQEFKIYQFILCLIVFVMLTALFTVMLCHVVKNGIRIIKAGLDDDKIKTEYLKNKGKKPSAIGKIFDKFLLGFCCIALFMSFGISLSVSTACNGDKITGSLPKPNVVRSASMSYISDKHKFLKEGEVTDQLQMFDLVFISELPKEMDLKENDIVVYEFKGEYIIHRIVAIEEPNEKHPNERHFLLQGDANDIADRFPVLYSQMKGIYSGVRVPFVGSFILFMQSPAGWLCILLVVVAIIATPIIEKRIDKAKAERIKILNLNSENLLVGIKEQVISEVNAKMGNDVAPQTVKVNVYDIFRAKVSQVDGKFSYTDDSGIKINSNQPILVDKKTEILNAGDIVKVNATENEK